MTSRTTHEFDGQHFDGRQVIFTFGSNLRGQHSSGTALHASRHFGAQAGIGRGPTGNAYAIPTRFASSLDMPLDAVLHEIGRFLEYAREHSSTLFLINRIGASSEGQEHLERAVRDAFLHAPANCLLPGVWEAMRHPDLVRLIVAGTRHFDDYALMQEKLDFLLQRYSHIEVISGRSRGADALGETYASERNLDICYMPADWSGLGRPAGPIRNEFMAWYGTHLTAFWDGVSGGTKGMIRLAEQAGLMSRVIRY
ncbi:SLOG family protein [Halomonas sp. I5-271120]|uniref:A1S_2505 family phage non-structural protein n=1 Tax=Halomonas sp. I5-271120 TaxID=3061632 RepID=UPI002714E859|nr:SLOG family protein [Halomonas sp. I5-271120]